MRTRIGCLHAHHSNIEYIEQAFSAYEVEFLHFADPALVLRVASDDTFSMEQAQAKVKEQMEWIAGSKVDAILITCTNYIALLQDNDETTDIPIIKIDEPFFRNVCAQEHPQILVFTNPVTVEGTMNRLNSYASAHRKSPVIEVCVAEGAFELLMQGKQAQYIQVLFNYMESLIHSESDNNKVISVAQLSMVEAARRMSEVTDVSIGDPLEPLISYVEKLLKLKN